MADYGDGAPRYPCKVCGRQFFQESLVKHEKICVKTTTAAKKRKVFDSTKQRAEGTDITLRQIKAAQKKTVAPPKSNWRAKHEDFINTVRSARGVSAIMAAGGPLPPPPPPSINPDYVQCPYCSRRFNQSAAERHINFCKEQKQRLPGNTAPNPAAKAKQSARLQYQAPRPKAKGPPGAGSPMGSSMGSPASSSSRLPGPGARAPAGRPGMGAPAPRGRGGSYQASMTVAGVKAGGSQLSPHRGGATSDPDKDMRYLRATTTISSSSTPSPEPPIRGNNYTSQQNKRGFPYNPHPKLSGIPNRGGSAENRRVGPGYTINNNSGNNHNNATRRDRTSQKRQENASGMDSGRREPSYADDFCDSGSDTSPQYYDENRYSSPQESQPFYKTRGGGDARQGGGRKTVTTSTAAGAGAGVGSKGSKFCHECGSGYPLAAAKFCCQCGMRRMTLSS